MFMLCFKANVCRKTHRRSAYTKIKEDSAQAKSANAHISFGYIN